MSARVAKLTTKRAIGLMGNHIANDGPKYSHSPELDVERPAILGVTADTEVNPRYLQRAGIPLEWVGAAAADLGLSGIAGEKMTAKVLQHGLGPQGQALRTAEVADNDQQRVLAYSVVYAAPKSISLLIAADHPQVRKAAHQALRAASEAYISALEQQLTVRRGKAGVRSERIPGLVAVRAIHQTSSTGDPHIHTHWLILSSAPSEADGAWRALDGRAFFQAQKLAESSANAALRQSLSASLGISDWTLVESGSCPAWEISGLLDQHGNLSTARQHLQQIADQLDVPFALRSRKMDERLWRQHREQKKAFAEQIEHQLDEALHQGGDKASAIRRLWQDKMADAGLLAALQSIQPSTYSPAAPAPLDFSDLSQKTRPTADALHQARQALQSVDLAVLQTQCQAAHARITRFDRMRTALPVFGDVARAKLAAAQALDEQIQHLQTQQTILDTEQVFQAADNLLDDLTQVLGTFTPSDIAARLIVTQDLDLSGSQQAASHLLRYGVSSGQVHLRAGCDLDVICHVLENHGFSPVTADRHMATRTQALIPDARLRAERALTEQARGLSERVRNRIVIPIPPTFTAEQAHTAAVLAQGRALTVTSGVAGSGKSYLAKPIVRAAQQQGFKVRVIARNRALAEALKAETGADAVDVFATFDSSARPAHKTLYIVDESGLADADDLKAVLQAVENHDNAQAWLIGDRAQSQPIDRRAAFAVVEQAVVPEAYTTLRTSYRCSAWRAEHDVLRQVADVPALVESVQQAGRLIRDCNDGEDRRAQIAGLAEQYRAQGEDVLILSRSNAEAGAIAEYVQAHRGITIHPATALRYEQQTGVGDLVRTRLNDRQKGIRNGDVWTVSQVTEDGALWLSAVKNPRRKVRVDKAYTEQAVELAYAATADAAQGVTVDRAIVDVSAIGKSLLYSAATRGRQAPVYVGDLASALQYDDVASTMRELLGPEQTALAEKIRKIQKQPLWATWPPPLSMITAVQQAYLQPELQQYDAALSHRAEQVAARNSRLEQIRANTWHPAAHALPPQWQAQNLWRVANVIQRDGTQHRTAVQVAWEARQAARRAAERARQWRLQQLENDKKEIKELIKYYDKQLLPEATDVEKARWRNIGWRVPSGRADDWWYVAEHPEWDDLSWDLSTLRATYKPLAKRQAALLQLEQTVFDVGLALRRGNLQETEAVNQIDNAMQQAAAAGLPDDMIEATTQRMLLKVRETIKREQAAAQAQAQQDAVLKIQALTDDIRQAGGWQEDRHRPAFVAAGFVQTGKPNIYRHPLEAATNVAEAQADLYKSLDEIRKAREQTRRRADIQQRWTARRERRIARYRAIIEKLIVEGPQGDFSDDDCEEDLYDDALDFYWGADTRQWRHPYQAILQEGLDRLRQALAEGRKRYEKEANERAHSLHLQGNLENMLASKTVEDLQPIADDLASMGCHRDASGHWGHQQAGTQRGADLDRLIHLFSAVEQHYATQRVGQIVRLAADVQQSGWQEDRHQEALRAAGFIRDEKSGQYSHPLSYIPAVQAAVITLFEVIKNPRPQTTPPGPTPPPSPWRPQGPR